MRYITKILKRFGLWENFQERPVANLAPVLDFVEYYDEEFSQLLQAEYEYEAC